MNAVIFFFKPKTAYEIKECDWSSDVCSSDLHKPNEDKLPHLLAHLVSERRLPIVCDRFYYHQVRVDVAVGAIVFAVRLVAKELLYLGKSI